MSSKNVILAPILKWVGGKRQLLDKINPLIPRKITTYVEPFVGGGAVLFDLQPKKAVINDYNSELINVYKVVKDNPDELLALLEEHDKLNNEEYYYKVRELDRNKNYEKMSEVEKAARIIYLNKTCFNGLFRVNQAGQFNSPYGRYKNPNIINKPAILAMSTYFNKNNIRILEGDYKQALKGLRKGAFVYFDPPYMPISTSSSFTGYTENGFSQKEQIELKKECDKLNERGINFLLSNSDHPLIRDLYKDYEIITVKARRSINSNGNKRGEINEVLVRNYGKDKCK
ncbi:DNA adenine methylase [Facklamia sp. P12934]|uniref:DNA adenine methylase n=1 Tax=unclassified Facklamia TaxID=2622293 RepID=UPI003D180CB6